MLKFFFFILVDSSKVLYFAVVFHAMIGTFHLRHICMFLWLSVVFRKKKVLGGLWW